MSELEDLRAQWWADVAALMNDRAVMWEDENRLGLAHECHGLANAFRTYAEGVGIPQMDTLRRKRREAEAEVERLREDRDAWKEINRINCLSFRVAIARAEDAEAKVARVEEMIASYQVKADAMAPEDDWGDSTEATLAADTIRAVIDHFRMALSGDE